jgi:hypothetical protein
MILSKLHEFLVFSLFKQLFPLLQAHDPFVTLANDVTWLYLWDYFFFIVFLRTFTLSSWIVSCAILDSSSIFCILSFLDLWLKKVIDSEKSRLVQDNSLTGIKSSPVDSCWKRTRWRTLWSVVFVSLLIRWTLHYIWQRCSRLKWLYQALLHFLVNFQCLILHRGLFLAFFVLVSWAIMRNFRAFRQLKSITLEILKCWR